jgi:hypothetical protein
VVFGPSATDDVVSTLPVNGTYYLLLEGRVSEGGPVNYSFRLEDTALPNSDSFSDQDFDVPGLPWVPASFSNSSPVVVPRRAVRQLPAPVARQRHRLQHDWLQQHRRRRDPGDGERRF